MLTTLTTTAAVQSRLGTIPAGTTVTLAPNAIAEYRTALQYRTGTGCGQITIVHPLFAGANYALPFSAISRDEFAAILAEVQA